MRVAPEIHLTKQQRVTLQRWSRGRKVAVRQAQRAKMILRAAEGKSNQEIAALLGVKVHTVGRWPPPGSASIMAKTRSGLARETSIDVFPMTSGSPALISDHVSPPSVDFQKPLPGPPLTTCHGRRR